MARGMDDLRRGPSFLEKTVRLGTEKVPGHGVRPGTTSAAKEALSTLSANAMIIVGVLKRTKNGMILVRFDHRNLRKLSAVDGQKSCGENCTIMSDEHDASAVRDSQRRAVSLSAIHTGGEFPVFRAVRPRRSERIPPLLQDETPIMRRLGRLHAKRFGLCVIPKFFCNYLLLIAFYLNTY